MPGWVVAVFAAMAALAPAIVYFTVPFTCYNCRGYGTRSAADAAPGMLSGIELLCAMLQALEPRQPGRRQRARMSKASTHPSELGRSGPPVRSLTNLYFFPFWHAFTLK